MDFNFEEEQFKRKAPIPELLRHAHPSYSYCGVCGLPWSHCEGRSVKFTERKGTFATCTFCWAYCDVEEVVKAHKDTYDMQQKQLHRWEEMEVSWEQMEAFVRKEFAESHKSKK